MWYIGVITHLLTTDPNFQRDIQVDYFRTIERTVQGGHDEGSKFSVHRLGSKSSKGEAFS